MTFLYDGVQYELENEDGLDEFSGGGNDNINNEVGGSDYLPESPWDPKNVHLFLDECIHRRADLQDPHLRRYTIFADIREKLKEKGLYYRIESLNRKLRNLKIHYIASSNRKKMKHADWPYLEKMKIIYPNEGHMKKELEKQKQKLSKQVHRHRSGLVSHPPSRTRNQAVPIRTRSHCLPDKRALAAARNQILKYEERRTLATEKIVAEIKKSNQFKRELLEISIKIFEAERRLDTVVLSQKLRSSPVE